MCIVGQDPYPSKQHATGYAFDVPNGKSRPSLEVLKFYALQYGFELDLNNYKDRVMLLNANLTTKPGIAVGGKIKDYPEHDWRWFTQQVVEYLHENNPSCQFAFLGKYAHSINTVNGLQFYHPASNKHGKPLFNESFYQKTNEYVEWK